MALQTKFTTSFATTRTQHLFSSSSSPSRSPNFTIRSEKPSESSDSAPKTPPGLGFGPSSNTSSSNNKKKPKQQKGQRASSIIRRTPVEKPAFVSEQQKQQQPFVEQSKNETAFILAWLGFGAVILVEGIALAASGFLPEEWDKLFVKYLYPSFTPTVFLFVAGAVAFGVFKYKQNENITDQK